MAKSKIFVGLEIGTYKVCLAVGEVRGDGAIKILGQGTHPSSGVRKGEITDAEQVSVCIREALAKAEEKSAVEVESVYLAITGAHITSMQSRGRARIGDDQSEITEEDLGEVKEMARNVTLPPDHGIIHSILQHYYVDGQEKVVNPVGMLGQKLEADYHIIHGQKNRVQNSIRCVRECRLEVEDIVFSPIAAAQVLLNRETRQQGAVLIDIGAGTTEYAMYLDGAIIASGCVGVGGDHLTNDLSIVLKLPMVRSEKLKIEHGSADPDSVDDEVIDLEADSHFAGAPVERSLLAQVIASRLRELFELIKQRLMEGGSYQKIGAGIFLTGGVSLTPGIGTLAEEIFELPVRRPGDPGMSGPSIPMEHPQYSVPIGLLRYAQLMDENRPKAGALASLTRRFKGMFGGGAK
ncbi:MAG: cell division protein FtsA [Verrucomicrobiales bacterium]|nr:cell division protein FtsA [Verrucomicrobiae bacterium]MCP5553802.1 cell division protein FtsA [Akkermansiaceae bacterium]HRX56534.1 cell division protein FtsA [Verrucomicrobiales bacterium]